MFIMWGREGEIPLFYAGWFVTEIEFTKRREWFHQ